MDSLSLLELLAMERLHDAWARVRGNRGAAGSDGVTLSAFGRHLSRNLSSLRARVLRDEYRPAPLLCVRLERAGRRPRMLAIPAIKDRILQTAMAMLLEPVLDADFADASFGFRRGRSVDQAVRRVIRYRDEGFRYVVDADISTFFDNIDHDRMLRELGRYLSEPRMLALVRRWLRAEVTDGSSNWCMYRGVAQGSPLSPLLSNLYLDHFDEQIMGTEHRLVRFADDFLILCRAREAAESALELTAQVLESLCLQLSTEKTRLTDFERGFRFLGVRFLRTLVIKSEHEDEPPATSRPASRYALDRTTTAAARSAAPAAPLVSPPAKASPDDEHMDWQDAEAWPEPDGEATQEGATFAHRPLLRSLYLQTPGSVAGHRGDRIVVRLRGEVIAEVPGLTVDLLLVFGNVQLSTQLMRWCMERGVCVALLSSGGAFHGMIDPFEGGHSLLQRAQFFASADADRSLVLARAMVKAKVANSLLVLRRYRRTRATADFAAAVPSLRRILAGVEDAPSMDSLRGCEGAAARAYFQVWRGLLAPQWRFERRQRRPPPDPVNALLSYGYTLLFANVLSMLRARGFNPEAGFLHPGGRGHPGLVSDLMEEFRAVVIDALVIRLLLNGHFVSDDFSETGTGVRLSELARRRFIRAFEQKMNTPVTHPAARQRLDYRRCIDEQARRLAAHLRGEAASYTGFSAR